MRRLAWAIGRVSYLYLLRIPLMTAAALVLLPVVALKNSNPILANLFDLEGGGLIEVMMVALIGAWTVMVTGWMVVLYGARRFKVPRIHICFPPKPVHVALFSLLAVPIAAGSVIWTSSQSNASVWGLLGYAAFGAAISVYALWRMLMLVNTLSGVADWITPLAKLGPGYTVSPTHASPELKMEWRSVPVNKFGRPIYRDPARMPGWKTGKVLLPGHALALASGIGFSILYLTIGIGKWVKLGNPPMIPTLGFVLLLLTIGCFVLTGMTFFFDRYRVPILLPILLVSFVTSQVSQGDHYFPVIHADSAQTTKLTPADALKAAGGTKAIVVAANGGGIQAAAWTAQVLTGLEEQCRAEAQNGCHDFARQVRFISSVSGGSVGSMYFVNGYDAKTHALPADLSLIRRRAQASSLDDVAWGLCYPDLWRILLPWFWKSEDRGMALENALTREQNLAAPLSSWREGVRDGWRPATVFNATVVETGAHLYLSTTDSSLPAGGDDLYSKNFAMGNDIKIVTAARLSASFPFVTPAARPDLPGAHFHVVDGGYYDNYGIATLVEWLDEALSASDNPIDRVLLINILGAPNDMQAQPKLDGWFYQVSAPIKTMLTVRSEGQFAHNKEEADLLTRLWNLREKNKVRIEQVTFQFCDANPPLSWHLSEKQKGAIEAAWKKELPKKWKYVANFLTGDQPIGEGSAAGCDSVGGQ